MQHIPQGHAGGEKHQDPNQRVEKLPDEGGDQTAEHQIMAVAQLFKKARIDIVVSIIRRQQADEIDKTARAAG